MFHCAGEWLDATQSSNRPNSTDGEALAISVPASETRVLKHFQERMPYGLFVPNVDAEALIAKASKRHDKPRRRAGPVSRAGMGRHLHHPAGRGGGHICTCRHSLEREAPMAALGGVRPLAFAIYEYAPLSGVAEVDRVLG
jgi:hypothetical protein